MFKQRNRQFRKKPTTQDGENEAEEQNQVDSKEPTNGANAGAVEEETKEEAGEEDEYKPNVLKNKKFRNKASIFSVGYKENKKDEEASTSAVPKKKSLLSFEEEESEDASPFTSQTKDKGTGRRMMSAAKFNETPISQPSAPVSVSQSSFGTYNAEMLEMLKKNSMYYVPK
jgi:hypothetical protein